MLRARSAAEFIERMGGTGHALDEDLEEFVSPKYAGSTIR